MTQPNGVATPFDDVDVDADAERDGLAPQDAALTDAETTEIDRQVAEITSANQSRTPAEQVSVAPDEVS